MKDNDGQEMVEGTDFNLTGHLEEAETPDIGVPTTLFEGDYMIYVPPGQKAVVTYGLLLDDGDTIENNPSNP